MRGSISLSQVGSFSYNQMAGKRKLKMTKKCIAARRCYRARKAGVPARRKRKKGSGFTGFHGAFGNPKKRGAATKRVNKGSGLRRKRKGRGRGRGRGRARGAGFLQDLGKSFEWVGNAALTALPFVAAVL